MSRLATRREFLRYAPLNDLTRQTHSPAVVTQLNAGQPVELPPYSLLRLVWQ